VRGRVRSVYSVPSSAVLKVNGVSFPLDIRRDRFMASIFFGDYQPEALSILRRYLKAGDTFIDVGANIGYLSAFAMGQVGPDGSVHAFEPVAEYYEALAQLRTLNPQYGLYANQLACGATKHQAQIMVADCDNIGANTMVAGVLPENAISKRAITDVISLGDYLLENHVRDVSLVKIDTEGYEFAVLKGMESYWRRAGHRPVMLVEIAPHVYPAVGVSLDQLQEFIESYGYCVRDPVRRGKRLLLRELQRTADVLLLPGD